MSVRAPHVHSHGLTGGNAVLHWLAFQRQGRFPCSVPLVLRALLHIFPTQNCHFFMGGPILALKRNVKRPCGLQTYIFPMKNQHFLPPRRPKMTQDHPKTTPRPPQDRPKTAQDHPRAPQERPMRAPRPPQDRPRPAQERYKTSQDRPKTAPRPPQDAPRAKKDL